MSQQSGTQQAPELQSLTGERLGPYRSFNPVSRVQIWQWCSAMGDRNPLFVDEEYRRQAGYDRAVAPPAMMQMWSMRDVNMEYAPGSTDAAPYQVFDTLAEQGFRGNVAVSYDISFHRLLQEGDRAHHYTTIISISDLKQTALGEGYFITERAEFLDQDETLFAEALITYFQYKPAMQADPEQEQEQEQEQAGEQPQHIKSQWQPDYTDIRYEQLTEGQSLPELVIPITHKLIISGAAATQDYIDVHHNAPAARAAAMPDIIMNILTTSGLCARYLSDWAGPASRLRKLSFKLMAPNIPGDTMVMQGRVHQLREADGENQVQVDFAGRNARGFHVTGAATLALAQ